ncbi:MAG: capsular biosynthesis protein [Bacteroidales bacterium]|nr:capsular biosynthesis protein [Bacteroidales bacterium]
MLGLFSRKKSLIDSGFLAGATDNHSHILWGVDDGVKTSEESLEILNYLESAGLKKLWLTPHTMEDVPNTTAALQARFAELKALYQGPVELELASEYMIDTLFQERLAQRDLLTHGDKTVLVETSTWSPPLGLWEILGDMLDYGYKPILAHPERYRYMELKDYDRLLDMGVILQLNLPSIVGHYGPSVQQRAEQLLEKGSYAMAGSDCHRYRRITDWYSRPVLSKKVLAALEPLLKA